MRVTTEEKVAVLNTRLKNGNKALNSAVDLLLDVAESKVELPADIAGRIDTFLAAFARTDSG